MPVPRRVEHKKISTPSKTRTPSSRVNEKIRPGYAKKNDYMTFGSLDVDIFKKMDMSKKRHGEGSKFPAVQKTQEDNTKTASLWSSQDESPSDQLAEISKKESQKSCKSVTPVSPKEPLPSKVPSSKREDGPSQTGKPRSDSLPEAAKTAKIKDDEEVKIGDKQSRIKHSSAENKREKQRVFKLLEAKINAVLKEEKSKDEKKDKKSIATKDKEQKKETEPSKEVANKDKNQKKEQKSQEDDKQNSDSSSESIRESRDGKSATDKISIMQPIVLDSEIESGMTISMKSEVSESTIEANMNSSENK